MTKSNQKQLEREVKEILKEKERYRWYRGIQKEVKAGSTACISFSDT